MTNPKCSKCDVYAEARDAGVIAPIPFWLCPQCKTEVSEESSKTIPGVPSGDWDEIPVMGRFELEGDDESVKLRAGMALTLRFGPYPPQTGGELSLRKTEALEVLTQNLGVEYNRAVKLIRELFNEAGWNAIDFGDNSNNSVVLGNLVHSGSVLHGKPKEPKKGSTVPASQLESRATRPIQRKPNVVVYKV